MRNIISKGKIFFIILIVLSSTIIHKTKKYALTHNLIYMTHKYNMMMYLLN